MKRRTFVAGLSATAGFPSAAFAQASSAVPEIALFYTGPLVSAEARAKMVRDDLGADGFVDGKNFVVSISVANNNSDELPTLARSLIRPSVKVILAIGPRAVRAALAATITMPIVALDLESDPVSEGFAQSLAHPGGNLTGLFFRLSGVQRQTARAAQRGAAGSDPGRRAVGSRERHGANRGRAGRRLVARH